MGKKKAKKARAETVAATMAYEKKAAQKKKAHKAIINALQAVRKARDLEAADAEDERYRVAIDHIIEAGKALGMEDPEADDSE